ncbi:MAG: hypothetical protein NT062_09495 [Proteobacteria bacterium]|nr:hypothetical protein [Pseudomonadota bacterium]
MKRSVGRWFAESPSAQIVVAASVLAIAFPRAAAGSISVLALVALGSIAIARHWSALPAIVRTPPADLAATVVLALVAAVGLATFWETLTVSPDWQMGDWGPQRTALAHLMPSLPGLDLPAWDHTVSTGDAPFDLYPALAYRLVGHLALVLGLGDDLPRAQMVAAVLVHVGLAVGTTAIALRFAPKPVALVVGLLALVDTGAVAHGGTTGLFRWALMHSAMSLAFGLIAVVGVLEALRRPRLGASLMIWLGTALATATHPAGLVAAAAACVGLLGVALLASDLPPRRALVAIFHLGLGMALSACIWMPLAARILTYGQHFPNALHTPGVFLEQLFANPTPWTSFAFASYAGFLGIIAGLWSRRGVVVFVAATALALFVGMTDVPYLALDLAPGQGIARLGVERLAQLARPLVGAAAAYTVALIVVQIRGAWQGAVPARKAIAAAVIGVMSVVMFRALPDFWRIAATRALAETRVIAPDPAGRDELVAWARGEVAHLTPGAWARALFEQDTHEQMHLTAITGMPTFHLGPIPDMLLRERIENTSPEALARFDVRWVVALGDSPTLGDPATERVFGTYHVREIAGWDGKFARIEQGEPGAQVVTTRLDSGAVEIDVTGTTAPVLVALGTGFYPRWRATHASGADEPVYARPSTQGATLHVVSAWVAPGHTTFTCDGPLPSDHDGRAISVLALLAGLGGIGVWTRRRWRGRVLRRIARARRSPTALRLAAFATRYGAAIVIVLVAGRAVLQCTAPARDLGVGSGLRPIATVEARRAIGGDWTRCGYSRLLGEYRCPGLVTIADATATTINDAAPSWPFVTPAIVASPEAACEVRITTTARLAGRYLASVSRGTAQVTAFGDSPDLVTRSTPLHYTDAGDRVVTITSTVTDGNWSFAFVRADTIIPDRPFLIAPPPIAPAAIRAIR